MSRIDLHMHSTCSDGDLTPTELVALCKEKDLKAIALTDHDTVNGLDEAEEAAKSHGIEFVPGIELVADYLGVEIHIVGLFIDRKSESLQNKMKQLKEERIIRNDEFIKRLKEMGIELDYENLEQTTDEQIITKAHFNNALVRAGYCKTYGDALKKFFSRNCYTNVIKTKNVPKDIIDTVKAAKGVAVLAHPLLYGLSLDEVYVLARYLKELGLDGMECHYGCYTKEQQASLLKIAKDLDLIPGGGSDFHSYHRKPHILPGYGGGNLYVPYSSYELILDRKMSIR